MTPVFEFTRKLDSLVLDRKFMDKVSTSIVIEGIYMFEKRLEILDLTEFKWVVPETLGKGPSGRLK